MKNRKLNILKLLFSIFAIVSMVSCDDERGYADYDAGGTPSEKLNGEWYIDVMDEASGTVYVQHAYHKMYDNNGKLMISDRVGTSFSGWWLESELDYDTENLTFSANQAENMADGSIVNITEGKILKGAAHSISGAVTDSIYFKGEFDYDPGTIIIFAGHRKTGFEEDEP